MNKTYLFLVMLALMVSSVFAVDLDYVLKTGQPVSISRPCFDQANTNGWCAAGTQCQLNVFDSDNNPVILGANMTNKISTHNITITNINTSGVFKADMACQTPTNTTGYDSFYFGINDAGRDYSGSTYLLYIIAGLGVLFGVLVGLVGDSNLRLAFILLTVLMLPLGLWTGLQIATNTWMGQNIINMIAFGFYVSLIGFGAVMLYVLWTMLMALRISRNKINTYNISKQGSPLHTSYTQKKAEYAEKHEGREYE